jgi:hypothetical protein
MRSQFSFRPISSRIAWVMTGLNFLAGLILVGVMVILNYHFAPSFARSAVGIRETVPLIQRETDPTRLRHIALSAREINAEDAQLCSVIAASGAGILPVFIFFAAANAWIFSRAARRLKELSKTLA